MTDVRPVRVNESIFLQERRAHLEFELEVEHMRGSDRPAVRPTCHKPHARPTSFTFSNAHTRSASHHMCARLREARYALTSELTLLCSLVCRCTTTNITA